MAAPRPSSQVFLGLVGVGAVAEGFAAWLAYDWAAQVLPCRFAPAQALLGQSSACPVPTALVGHRSFVPALLLGSLVVLSAGLFAFNLARYSAEQSCHLRSVALLAVARPPSLYLGALHGPWEPKRLVVVESEAATAYCVGLTRPCVVVPTGLVKLLGGAELAAVVAHEASHERRHDPLRAAVAKSLARALFFVPWLRDLCEAVLVEDEISADEAAVAVAGRASLSAALLVLLRQSSTTAARVAGRPGLPGTAAGVASRHFLNLRLDALETGKRPRFQLRLWPMAASAALMAALAVTAAWVPHYSRARIVESPSHPVAPQVPAPGPPAQRWSKKLPPSP